MAGFDPMAFGSLFWMAMVFVVAGAAGVLALVHEFVIMPPIARKLRKAKWSKSSPAFIQDDSGRVHFIVSDVELPEGVVHTKRGWFLRSRSPYIPSEEVGEDGKRKRGKAGKLSSQQEAALTAILAAPVLEGLGKAVFFGYDGAPLLSNLKTLAVTTNNAVLVKDSIVDAGGRVKRVVSRYVGHADLRVMKELIPASLSRTQIGNLIRWATAKGYEKRGGDTNKIVILAISVIAVVATVGLVFYFITQGKAA